MQKIDSTKIKAELILNDEAESFFRFPILSSFRISLWTKNARYSTPSEIVCNVPINKNCIILVDIKFPSDYLNRKISINDEFFIGTFPIVIGNAKVLEIIKY